MHTACRFFWEAGALEALLAYADGARNRVICHSQRKFLHDVAERLPLETLCRYPFGTLYVLLPLLLYGGGPQERLAVKLLGALREHVAASDMAARDRILGECQVLYYFAAKDGARAQEHLLAGAPLLRGEPSLLLHPEDPFTYGLPGLLYQDFHRPGELEETLRRTDAVPFEALCPGLGQGSDRLARAEAALERHDMAQAEVLARQALLMANEARQFQVAAGAWFVLLRRALHAGDAGEAQACWEAIRQMEREVQSSEHAPFNRRLLMDLVDLSEGWLLTGCGMPRALPDSLSDEEQRGGSHGGPHHWMMGGMGLPALVRARAALVAEDFPRLEVLAEICLKETQGLRQLGALHGMILLAVARWRMQKMKEALGLLGRAVEEAAIDGVLLPFMEYAPHTLPLLKHLAEISKESRVAAFLGRVLHHCGQAAARRVRQAEVPYLTARELDVLRLTEQGLTRVEIASQCGIREDTVRKHLLATYRKLGVNNKVMALNAARRLRLLA